MHYQMHSTQLCRHRLLQQCAMHQLCHPASGGGSIACAFTARAWLQACAGVIDGYLFVYLEKLGASVLLMGLMLAVTAGMELPVFRYSGNILSALGYNGALKLALCAFALRLTAYSCINFAPSVWMVTPVEMLHSFTFGVAWTAGCELLQERGAARAAGLCAGLVQ